MFLIQQLRLEKDDLEREAEEARKVARQLKGENENLNVLRDRLYSRYIRRCRGSLKMVGSRWSSWVRRTSS